jgi:predicted phosphodiesterase
MLFFILVLHARCSIIFIMSKIYITGDTHGDPVARLSTKKFPEGKDLTKDDFVIIAGDFGAIWMNEPDKRENYIMKWLQDKPWTTLFIDGNHENFERLLALPVEEKFGGNVGMVRSGIYHLKRGELYLIGGKKFFCFGGAYSWDRYHRTLGLSLWEEEVPNHKEMDYGIEQLESVDYKVDYVITHTLPQTYINRLTEYVRLQCKDMKKNEIPLHFKMFLEKDSHNFSTKDPTPKYLDHLAEKLSYTQWYCGHLHIHEKMENFYALFEEIVEII